MTAFAKVIDSENRLVTLIDWRVVTGKDGRLKDSFIDSNGNIYFEQPHSDGVDGIMIMGKLQSGANQFYKNMGTKVLVGRCSCTS